MAKLTLISTGAGGDRYLTCEAKKALLEADIVVGYTKYLKDLKELINDKETYSTGMTKELQRVQYAIDQAKEGKNVALVSNGDANIYGMGSLVVELLDTYNLWDKIEYIALPGISSVLALASEIGAPLSQDLALISLSDRLTDFDLIQKRISLALEADFIIAIYNPKSKSRLKPYEEFLEKLKNYKDRVVVIATNLGREKQIIKVTNANELIKAGVLNEEVNMSTTILIGNSTTKLTKNNLVLTPRGYLNKYDLDGNQKENFTKIS
jgi:precorrin-3B C17-methyltransferase